MLPVCPMFFYEAWFGVSSWPKCVWGLVGWPNGRRPVLCIPGIASVARGRNAAKAHCGGMPPASRPLADSKSRPDAIGRPSRATLCYKETIVLGLFV